MTIGELLEKRGLSRYRLSKESGVPWATLSDICSGKTKMNRCSAETLLKLSKALDEYIQGEKDGVSYMDCLWGELYGSINACQWGDEITKEHADYLRKKYLYGAEEVAEDD